MTPKEKFIELITEGCRVDGLDNLTSKIIGVLFAESEELSLGEISEKVGYSLSGTSTALKFLERSGLVKKFTKPKSKKVYFHIGEEILSLFLELMEKKYNKMILPAKIQLPEIIKGYKENKDSYSKEELKRVEDYYKQTLLLEKLLKKMIEEIRSI
jgi:DNA-binding transcriptional regulator GbsR (MarR family)